MNKKHNLYLFILLFAMTLTSCDLSYEKMLEEYNNCFGFAEGTESVNGLDDESFKESLMIPLEAYNIEFNTVFSICAPEGGSETVYNWTVLYCPKGKTKDESKQVYSTREKVLKFKPSDSVYVEGSIFYLQLAVSTERGTSNDSAWLMIGKVE